MGDVKAKGGFRFNVDVDRPFPKFKNYGDYKAEAQNIVSKFDKDDDGAISRDESKQVVLVNSGLATKTIRADSYKREEKIPYNRYATFKPGAFDKVNRTIGKDGLVTANDLLHYYESTKDKNGNDQLDPIESFGMSPKGMLKQVFDDSYEFPTEKKGK